MDDAMDATDVSAGRKASASSQRAVTLQREQIVQRGVSDNMELAIVGCAKGPETLHSSKMFLA